MASSPTPPTAARTTGLVGIDQDRQLVGVGWRLEAGGVRLVARQPRRRSHPTVMGRRDRIHHHHHAQQDSQRGPDPQPSPVAAHEARRDAGAQQDREPEVRDAGPCLRQREQLADPASVTLTAQAEGDDHGCSVAEREREGADDVGQHNPGVHAAHVDAERAGLAEPDASGRCHATR